MECNLVWNHTSDFKIGQVRVQFELQVCMISDQHCMTQSSITTYYSHRRIQSVPILLNFDLVASFLKSGKKKAFISHFVPETEMMQYRVKMVWFQNRNEAI